MHDTPAELASIAAPAAAHHVEPWVDETGTGVWGRFIRGTRRAVAGVEVVIAGWQSADGTVKWHANVWAPDAQLKPTRLRKLAAALRDTADELRVLALPPICSPPRGEVIDAD